MRRDTGFGNCDNVAVADDPGQRNRGGRAIVFGTDTCQRTGTYQKVTIAAEWRIRHHEQIVLFAPWQKVTLNAAVVQTVRDLIRRAAMAVWDTKEIFHLPDVEVGYAPISNLLCRT